MSTCTPNQRPSLQNCNILCIYALAIRLFGRDPNDESKPVLSIGQWALLFQLASWSPPQPPTASKTNRFQVQFLRPCAHVQQLDGSHPHNRLPVPSLPSIRNCTIVTILPFASVVQILFYCSVCVTLSACTTGLGTALPQSLLAAAKHTASGTFSRQKPLSAIFSILGAVKCNPHTAEETCSRRRWPWPCALPCDLPASCCG